VDCSTWFLVEKQPKTPYPPLPRFSARGVLWGGCVRVFCWGCVRFFVGWDVALSPVSARLLFRQKTGTGESHVWQGRIEPIIHDYGTKPERR
jgi:hypothetical protein